MSQATFTKRSTPFYIPGPGKMSLFAGDDTFFRTVDENGIVRIIPYTGTQTEITTGSNVYETISIIPVDPGVAVHIKFSVGGVQGDGNQRCFFERWGFFYRNGSNGVETDLLWEAVYTNKSAKEFDVAYALNFANIDLRVKAANSSPTKWVAKIETFIIDLS